MSESSNVISGLKALEIILSNPKTELEKELVEAYVRYEKSDISILYEPLWNMIFGSTEEDLSDNLVVDYLTDYINNQDLSNEEDKIKQLEEKYQLTTIEGFAKFNADSHSIKKAGDSALFNTLLERCGLELNDSNISKIISAYEATKPYTEEITVLLKGFTSREDLCYRFIEFERIYSERIKSKQLKATKK